MLQFAREIERYAEIAVRIGINLQPGQVLSIRAETYPEAVTFVRQLTEKAYAAGARLVHVHWSDPVVGRLTTQHADAEELRNPAPWTAKHMEEIAAGGGAFISVMSPNPDLMQGVDPERLADTHKAGARLMAGFSRYTSSLKVNWVGLAVPTQAWADKVFQHLPPEERLTHLWQNVLFAVRATADDPIEAWKAHLTRLAECQAKLNRIQFKRLRYKAPGTDLTVELPEHHVWISGGNSQTPEGVAFVPNLPTEEVFTAPLRDGVNGVVRATLPLVYSGVVITDLAMRLEGGRIVECTASQGQEVVRSLIETDEGSHFLGEVALVPVDSPICQLNTLFYNTLYDENASCHFALGRCYPVCVEGGGDMTPEQLVAKGLNWSNAHTDFMIGSAELDIDGETADGQVVPVFRKGRWAL